MPYIAGQRGRKTAAEAEGGRWKSRKHCEAPSCRGENGRTCRCNGCFGKGSCSRHDCCRGSTAAPHSPATNRHGTTVVLSEQFYYFKVENVTITKRCLQLATQSSRCCCNSVKVFRSSIADGETRERYYIFKPGFHLVHFKR